MYKDWINDLSFVSDGQIITKQENPQLELNVQVYNINYNKDPELLSKSIYEYSTFIHCANEKRAAGLSREEAVKQAMRECIESDIMAEYLLKNGSEVTDMLYFEWKEDALKYAKEEGRNEERKEMICAFSKKLSLEDIAETLHATKEYVLEVLKDDSTMYAYQPTATYNTDKTE